MLNIYSGKLFQNVITRAQNLKKVIVANSHLNITKGTRLVTRHRKYRRPEESEDPFYYGKGPKDEVKAACQSIAARGFAKEQLPYNPPEDVEEQLYSISKKVFGSELSKDWKSQSLSDPLLKYKVLTKCMSALKRQVPNSYLHQMSTIEDLLHFFNTPVQGINHFDAMLRDQDQLPPNLHVIHESSTFSTNSTFFDGITAFPGRKRIVYTKLGEKFQKILEWPNI